MIPTVAPLSSRTLNFSQVAAAFFKYKSSARNSDVCVQFHRWRPNQLTIALSNRPNNWADRFSPRVNPSQTRRVRLLPGQGASCCVGVPAAASAGGRPWRSRSWPEKVCEGFTVCHSVCVWGGVRCECVWGGYVWVCGRGVCVCGEAHQRKQHTHVKTERPKGRSSMRHTTPEAGGCACHVRRAGFAFPPTRTRMEASASEELKSPRALERGTGPLTSSGNST